MFAPRPIVTPDRQGLCKVTLTQSTRRAPWFCAALPQQEAFVGFPAKVTAPVTHSQAFKPSAVFETLAITASSSVMTLFETDTK